MTEEELKALNPWNEVANMINPEEKDCLFRDENKEWYVYSEDKERITEFNKNCKEGDTDLIITNTPPEPWRGNPLTANLIILTLNPGYDPNINKSLANLIQSVDNVRKELVTFRKRTLQLEAASMMPEIDHTEKPISCKEAEDMLSGWYWTKNLKALREQSELSENEFWKRIAVIEFHGYSSTTCNKRFPLCGKDSSVLKSQSFNKDLIEYIVNNRGSEVRFLIVRAKKQWVDFLGNIYNENLFLSKENKGRSPSVTKKNLAEKDKDGQIEKDIFEEIKKAVQRNLK